MDYSASQIVFSIKKKAVDESLSEAKQSQLLPRDCFVVSLLAMTPNRKIFMKNTLKT